MKELEEKSTAIEGFVFPDNDIPADMTDLEKAVYACAYLINRAEYSSARTDNTAYSALIEGKANSQGLSMALCALSGRLGLDCRLVYGQKNWQNHYWNIVRIEDKYYHIDIQTCLEEGIREGFLLNDERMWVTYRWDMSGYPRCSEALDWSLSLFDPYLITEEEEPPSEEPEPEPEIVAET